MREWYSALVFFFSSVLEYIFIFDLVRYFCGQCVRGLVWLVEQGKRHQFESFLQKLLSGYCQRILSIFITLQFHFRFLGTSLKVFLFFVLHLLKERFGCCLFLKVSCFIFSNRCHGRAIQCNRDSARERCHQFKKKTRICHLPCFDFQVWM